MITYFKYPLAMVGALLIVLAIFASSFAQTGESTDNTFTYEEPKLYTLSADTEFVSNGKNDGGADVVGTFVLDNRGYSSGENLFLGYELLLFEEGAERTNYGSQNTTIVDQTISNVPIGELTFGTSTHPFTFTLPKNIFSGAYALNIPIYDEFAGVVTTYSVYLGEVAGLSGRITLQRLELIAGGKSFQSNIGIAIKPEDQAPVCRATLSSTFGAPLTVTAQTAVFKRIDVPKNIVAEDIENNFSIKANGETVIDIPLPKLDVPQSYVSETRLLDKDGIIAPPIYCRWVIRGISASIGSVTFEDVYREGAKLRPTVVVYGPADLTSPHLDDDAEHVEASATLSLSLEDEAGNVLDTYEEEIVFVGGARVETKASLSAIGSPGQKLKLITVITSGETVLDDREDTIAIHPKRGLTAKAMIIVLVFVVALAVGGYIIKKNKADAKI